jgi:hypothetical protein
MNNTMSLSETTQALIAKIHYLNIICKALRTHTQKTPAKARDTYTITIIAEDNTVIVLSNISPLVLRFNMNGTLSSTGAKPDELLQAVQDVIDDLRPEAIALSNTLLKQAQDLQAILDTASSQGLEA